MMARTASIRKANAKYDRRTGADSRAAATLAAAHFAEIKFHEDEDGNRIREWKHEEMQRFTNAQLRDCLSNLVAVTEGEMLGTVPASAIKYCVTKGWLRAAAAKYLVTFKAALELDLPMRFRGM